MEAILQAAPYLINALGGIFGKRKKYIDPEELRQRFGPSAISKDAQDLTNFIINSPYGQQLLSSAAEQGQGLQTQMAARAASAGLAPGAGGSSGASDFATSAATQAQAGLERGVKADILRSSIPVAANLESGYANVAQENQLLRNMDPSIWQRISGAAGAVQPRFNYGNNVQSNQNQTPGEEAGAPYEKQGGF